MDTIMKRWLARQSEEWERFRLTTDAVSLQPLPPEPTCQRYIAEFRCRGLVWEEGAGPVETDRFVVGIHIADDHLRRMEPLALAWILAPENTWHPNIKAPVLCPGHLRTGIGLIDLLHQIHSILTYQNMNMADCLNEKAAAWARNNQQLFPIDRRPLRRRDMPLEISEVTEL